MLNRLAYYIMIVDSDDIARTCEDNMKAEMIKKDEYKQNLLRISVRYEMMIAFYPPKKMSMNDFFNE